MIHIDEDSLLAYVLEVSESDDERDRIAAHLKECAECQASLESLQSDVAIICGVQPVRRVLPIPEPKVRHVNLYSMLRVAALIVFGVFLGFGASSRLHREPAHVSPSYVTLSPPSDQLNGHAVTDATEISAHYYDIILRDQW